MEFDHRQRLIDNNRLARVRCGIYERLLLVTFDVPQPMRRRLILAMIEYMHGHTKYSWQMSLMERARDKILKEWEKANDATA